METPSHDPLVYFVSGMWCTSCARGVREAASQVDGVASADVNYASKLLRVDVELPGLAERVDEVIQARVQQIGFCIKKQSAGWVVGFHDELKRELDGRLGWTTVALVWFLAMWSSMLGFARYAGGDLPPQGALLLSLGSSAFGLPAIVIGIVPYAASGIRSLYHNRRLSLDLFVFLGGISAVLVSLVSLVSRKPMSYADSGSMVVALLLLTKKIENTILKQVSSKLLFQLGPKRDRVDVWKSGAWQEAEAHQIRRGDRVRFGAGQTIALDGAALGRSARVNAHLLSGESAALDAAEGAPLLAGMIAVTELEMLVREPVGKRRIDAWAEAALAGSSSDSPYPVLFARIEAALSTAALTGAALLSFSSWVRTGSAGQATEAFFIGVLVFCPCLFATILPLAKQIAHLALWRSGVELTRSDALLDLCRVRHFYFDKTGTLEEISSHFEPFLEAPDCSSYLQELALRSQHPILRGLESSGSRSPLRDIREIPGLGLSALTEREEKLVLGRPAFLRQNGVAITRSYDRDFPLVALGGRLAGQLLVKRIYDVKSRRFLLRLLRTFPTAEAQILSGDPAAKAAENFRDLGNRVSYRGNLSPEDKAACIRPASAFLGDGLNDTLAMAKADVSIRIGHRATGFAPADLHLLSPNLDLFLRTAYYARKYRRVLMQTALAALAYNLIAFALAFQGRFSPLGAVLAMLFSFLLLLLSILRLMRVPEVPQ